jgi:acyl carrier protein
LESSDLSDDDQLMDHGLGSFEIMEIAGQLASEFGIRLLPTLLFNYPTIGDIIGHLCEKIGIVVTTSSFSNMSKKKLSIVDESNIEVDRPDSQRYVGHLDGDCVDGDHLFSNFFSSKTPR